MDDEVRRDVYERRLRELGSVTFDRLTDAEYPHEGGVDLHDLASGKMVRPEAVHR
jgi:hypothetical protein